MVIDGDSTWGDEHTIQCTDDVLELWTLNPYKFLTTLTPMNSIK